MFAGGVQVIAGQAQLSQFVLQVIEIEPEIEHGAEEHIAANAAKNVQVKGLH
jgi:hypothetical protein